MATKNALPQGHILKSPTYTYRIESVLGYGGFGITYLASTYIKVDNVTLKVKFAIKEHFISGDCERDVHTNQVVYSNPAKERVEGSRKDFLAEARRVKQVGGNHPNIVRVNEVFEANNTAYYVMEYLDGESLHARIIKNGAMDEDTLISTLNPIIEAVEYLHKNRMTHLDIKPDNIMLTHDEDGGMRPVLIDFGLSKHYDKNGNPTSTINTLGCSDGYAPMEQYAGITTFSPTADIYALGATMYFCATAKRPKKSTELIEGELSSEVESISKEISAVIGKACSLNKNTRSIQPFFKQKEYSKKSTDSAEQINRISGKTSPADTSPTEKIDDGNRLQNTKDKIFSVKKPLIIWIIAIIIIATAIIWPVCIKHHVEPGGHDSVDTSIEHLNDTTPTETPVEDQNDSTPTETPTETPTDYSKLLLTVLRSKAKAGDPEAQNELGDKYYNGNVVPEDYAEAVKWYRKAAEQGCADAQNNLGFMYKWGRGVTQDYFEAERWYRKAAERGHAVAQLALGGMYEYGTGVNKNINEAVKWYRKAAEQGYPNGQNILGELYEEGKGVTKDINEAVKWYRKAAAQGDDGAIENLERLGY